MSARHPARLFICWRLCQSNCCEPQSHDERTARAVLKIFASERLTSLAEIVGVFFRMAKHRSLIVSRQAQRTQSISLKFRSEVWRDLEGLRRTDLASGNPLAATRTKWPYSSAASCRRPPRTVRRRGTGVRDCGRGMLAA